MDFIHAFGINKKDVNILTSSNVVLQLKKLWDRLAPIIVWSLQKLGVSNVSQSINAM